MSIKCHHSLEIIWVVTAKREGVALSVGPTKTWVSQHTRDREQRLLYMILLRQHLCLSVDQDESYSFQGDQRSCEEA